VFFLTEREILKKGKRQVVKKIQQAVKIKKPKNWQRRER
jgi:hypothetical protein